MSVKYNTRIGPGDIGTDTKEIILFSQKQETLYGTMSFMSRTINCTIMSYVCLVTFLQPFIITFIICLHIVHANEVYDCCTVKY